VSADDSHCTDSRKVRTVSAFVAARAARLSIDSNSLLASFS
jgi:hypothetical protein